MGTKQKTTGWLVGMVECSDCGRSWVAVRPAETETSCLECPSCGQQGHTHEFEYDEED